MTTSATGTRPRSRPQGKYLARIRLAVYRRDGFTCQHCGWAPPVPDGYDGRYALGESYTCPRTGKYKFRLLELDHIYPHLLGGKFRIDNLQALCNPCNVRKGARV